MRGSEMVEVEVEVESAVYAARSGRRSTQGRQVSYLMF